MANTIKPGGNKKSPVALLIIDMINSLDFARGDKLLKQALPAARTILQLKQRLKQRGVPVLYVNDNFGQWQSSREQVFAACSHPDSRGAPLATLLEPEHDDYFVLKPKHSAFYSTHLDVLLDALGAEHLILTGIAGNICVLFTANDAHMRNYSLHVPADCVASNTARENSWALKQMHTVLQTDIRPARALLRGPLRPAARKRAALTGRATAQLK